MAVRPPRFGSHRYVGDKRTQVVYDVDDPSLDQFVVDELVRSEQLICFAPDTLAEARNRCYKLYKPQRDRA